MSLLRRMLVNSPTKIQNKNSSTRRRRRSDHEEDRMDPSFLFRVRVQCIRYWKFVLMLCIFSVLVLVGVCLSWRQQDRIDDSGNHMLVQEDRDKMSRFIMNVLRENENALVELNDETISWLVNKDFYFHNKWKACDAIISIVPEESLHEHDAETECNLDSLRIHLRQRYILAHLYFSTHGDSWTNCNKNATSQCGNHHRFLSNNPECNWYGIRCSRGNGENKLIWIDLSSNNLKGEVPWESIIQIGDLGKSLELIWLQDNQLHGNLDGSWHVMRNMKTLNLSNNSFSSTIPSKLFKMEKLASLRLNDNMFSGKIPEAIGDLRRLSWLMLHNNNFEGTLPATLSKLALLEAISVFGNKEEFLEIPSSICELELINHVWSGCHSSCHCCSYCQP